MIYFFYGPDDFRLKEKLGSVIREYKTRHQSGLDLAIFDFEESDFEKFRIFFESYSMFSEKKLGVVKNLFAASLDKREKFLDFLKKNGLAKDKESFLAVAENLKPTEEKKRTTKYVFPDEISKDIFSFLTAKPALAEEFEVLQGIKLENWIKKRVEKEGAKINDRAIKKLVEFAGADLWRLKSEIEKLVSFRSGELILEKDVDELVDSRVETDIFKTVDALASRQRAIAFRLLRRHLARGESELYLLSMLAYQFRNLLVVKDQTERGEPFYALQKKLKMHPFVLKKTFDQSKNFSFGALKKIYGRLEDIDHAIKTGRLEGQTALDLLVAEIAG